MFWQVVFYIYILILLANLLIPSGLYIYTKCQISQLITAIFTTGLGDLGRKDPRSSSISKPYKNRVPCTTSCPLTSTPSLYNIHGQLLHINTETASVTADSRPPLIPPTPGPSSQSCREQAFQLYKREYLLVF